MMNQQRIARDLLWAVNSVALLNNALEFTTLNAAKIDLRQLAESVGQTAEHRVGRYFERLIGYWLGQQRGVSQLEHSRQIHDGNRTIGELDFLFTDERDQRTHLEIAVKFYLYHPQASVLGSHFIGPNAGDTFERKMSRLFEHQLPLGRCHVPEVTQTQAIVKGRIFYHPGDQPPNSLPEKLSPKHLQGTWIRASEPEYFCEQPESSAYRVLRKPYWLSDEVAESKDELLGDAQLCQHLDSHFGETDRPVLISQLVKREQRFEEVNRIFVVANSWPIQQTR